MNKKKSLCNNILVTLCVILTVVYVAWRIMYTFPIGYGISDKILAAAFLTAEICGIIFLWLQLFLVKRSDNYCEENNEKIDDFEYPETDIYVLNRYGDNESLCNTMNACRLVDYPDKNKLHIIQIDGGMEKLNQSMAKSKSKIIAVVEAGMIPRHEFLLETVPYLMNSSEDKKTGFVQSAIGYFNADTYQFRLFSHELVTNEKRYLFNCQQPVFDVDNSVICCGSGAVFLREAIDDIGGFDTNGAQGYMATGIRILKKGYKSKYIKDKLVSGFFDSDIATNIMKKKLVAADAVYSAKIEHVILGRGLTFKQKKNIITYLVSLSNPFRSTINIIIPILCAVLGITVVKSETLILAAFWILISILSSFTMRKVSNNTTSLKWRQIYEASTLPFLLWPCIKAYLGKYSPKHIEHIKANKFKNIRYFIPHIILAALDIIAFIMYANLFIISGELINIVFMVWIIANMYFEFMSIVWLMGRPYVRHDDRVFAQVNYKLTDNIQTICGVTRDISPRGVSLWCDKPYDIDNEETVSIELDDGRYHINVEGNVIGVERDAGHWKYIVLFQDIEHCKQQYYGMLYDREPIEVTELASPQNIFNDIKRNVGKRFKNKKLEYRRMVRVPINKELDTSDGNTVFAKNYNYKYLMIKSKELPDEHITVIPVNDVELKCERIHRFGEHIYQYSVLNYCDIRNDEKTREKLYDWTCQCYVENVIGLSQDMTGYSDVLEKNKIIY